MKAKLTKLFTLLAVLLFGIGNVWGALTAHVPGVYEKTVATGGYGCTLTTVASGENAGTFEVYYFSAQSKYGNTTDVYGGAEKQQYRLMCTDSDSEYQLINRNGTGTFTASCDWIEMAYGVTGFSKSDYTFGSNKFNEFFEITPNGGNTGITKTCYIKPKEGDVLTLKVSGYVEFAILGNDNGSSKYMTVAVDGGTPTSWKSNTLSRRSVTLTTGEHTIVVANVGNSANAFYGFSLKLPSCAAGAPGNISKGTLSAGVLTLNAAGSAASGDTWYWQSSATGEDKTNSGSSFNVSAAGTYYIRSYNTADDCWSNAKSITISATDLVANYTVVYKDGTTELGSEVVEVGEHPTGSEVAAPTKDCYTFAGWDPALSGVSGSDGDEIEVNATWTPLYASSFNFGTTTDLTKDNIATKLAASNIFCSVGTGGSYDAGGTTGYLGYKFKNNGDYVTFIVQNGYEAIVTYGYTESGWQVNGADAGVTVKTQAYVDKKYQANGSDLLLKLVNQSANTKTSVLTNIVIKATATGEDDATLSDLSVSGYTLNPSFDSATEDYTITKEYGATDPVVGDVTATPSVTGADVDVAWDGTNKKFTITVTALDNTTEKTYTITINEAEAPKSLSRVLFSNGFDAFIDNTNHTVKAYYLAGTSAPTATTITAGAGTAGEYAEGKITVTGADDSTVDYIVTLEAVTPNTTTVAEADPAGEFAGDEAWVKNGLLVYGNAAGFNADNKWYVNRRLLKNTDAADDQRVIAGWVRSYFFVGNASKFIMTVGANKKLKYSVDGGEAVAVEPTTLEIALPDGGNHMIEIVSNQSSGDCQLSAPKLVEIPEPVDPTLTYNNGAYEIDGAALDLSTLINVKESTGAITYTVKTDGGTNASIDGNNFTATTAGTATITASQAAAMGYNAISVDFNVVVTAPIIPVDPTLTYNNGAYTAGTAALDLSTLIDESNSTGAITYTVKTDGGTNASIDGNNFTATTAGTATITASQAAVSGFNAITVDFNVVVSVPAEKDGIKLVEAGALTGNYRIKADQLKTGAYTVEGINYAKYVQMGSTHTSFSGETEGNQTKGIYFAPTKKNIKFWFYMRNTDSSARKIYIYKMEEGSSVASATVTVEPGSQLVSYDMTLSTNAEVIFGVENTKLYFCQIVAVESGDALLQGGEAGYVFDYSKKRQNIAANTLRTIDGIDYKLSAESKINSASNVQLTTLGTHYIKFHLDAPKQVSVYADNKKYYIGSECSTEDAAKLYEATGNGEFTLAAGDWYINGSGAQVKINKLEFALPKCKKPTVADLADVELCAGEPYTELTVSATKSDEGTLHYAWFKEAGETDEAVGTDAATYTPAADGEYYVIVTNTLAGHQDNAATSNTISVAHFASVAITAAPEDVYKHAGLDAELSVVATGKNLTYEWFTCDDELGTNPVSFDPAETGASLNLTAIEAGIKYYQVVVTDECGTTASAVAKVEGFDDLLQVDVTATTTWDITNVSANAIELSGSDKNARLLLANIDGVNNNASFNSQALMFEGQHIGRTGAGIKHLAGRYVQFNVTVPGAVFVTFESNGNNARTISINGKKCARTTSGTAADDYITYALAVEPGSVEIIGYEGESANQYVRISKIEFKAEYNYTRSNLNPNNIGTLCWTNDAILGGATLYELNGKNEHKYLVFDEVVENRIEKGKPYIFVPKNGNTEIKIYNTSEAALTNDDLEVVNGMKGTFVRLSTVDDGENSELWNKYIFKDNKYIFVDANNCNLGAYRAYIVSLDDIAAATPPSNTPNGMPRQRLTVGGPDNLPTGIDDLNVGDQPMKVMINGQLFILRGDKMFDATGRIVK